jgi:hypothetical protein
MYIRELAWLLLTNPDALDQVTVTFFMRRGHRDADSGVAGQARGGHQQLLDILDNAVDDWTDRWINGLDFNVHTTGRCPFRRRWPGIGRRNADESGLWGLFLPAATAGHRPREHGGRDNHDVDFQFLNCC